MKFKSGDVVIKTTGGNKMTIGQCYHSPTTGNGYQCYWFIESSLHESDFVEDDIVSLQEYKRYLKIEEREDKINQLLRDY
jgi:uncharacterized protein YodC (DUF2158 family)